MKTLATDTAMFLAAAFNLFDAMRRALPAFDKAAEVRAGVRVTFDTRERIIMVGTVDDDGRGDAVLVIPADPEALTFGAVVIPDLECPAEDVVH